MFVIPTRCLSANGNPKKNNNYYSYKTFKRLGIPALVYSGVSKVAVQLLQVKPKEIPKTHDGANGESKRRRVALVTGSNTGVGFETAKSLAQEHGLEVIIACRSVDKGVETCRKINEMSSRGMAVFVQSVNLADMQSVRAFANAVNRQYETIDVLVNNAGCNSVGASSSKNETGLDVVFSTNFLGHFLLTNLLLEKCRRIVNLASVMHHFPIYNNPAKDDISQLEFWKRMALEPKDEEEKSRRKTYGPSKLAALLFSIELNRRYGETKGIRSIAVNPGAV